MKHFIRFISVTTCILIVQFNMNAQDRISIFGTVLADRTVLLRWAPDEKTFDMANKIGYSLIRYESWEGQSYDEYLSTEVYLLENKTAEGVSPKSNQAIGIMSANVKDSISQARNFKDAVKYTRAKESQYIYSMIIADRDFTVAKELGLGFEDNSEKDPSKRYVYKLLVGNDSISTSIEMNVENIPEKQTFPELSGVGDNKAAVLSWDLRSIETYCNAYLIYKDNICINQDDPFVPMNSTEHQDEIIFVDTLSDNVTPHDYYVVGMTIFGETTHPSNTVQVKGLPPGLDVDIAMDSLSFGVSDMTLHWKVTPISQASLLSGFNVYRLLDISGKAEKINASLISNNINSFVVNNPISAAYYYIEANDSNGRKYQSIAVLGQPKDISPPAAPTGLEGFISRTGDIKLKWNKNTETDLDGYLVFYSNLYDGDYSQWTNKPTNQNEYSSVINTSFALDSIFIKIAAVDLRFNKGSYSAVLRLARPDITAPSKPIIHHLLARETGVRIAWALPTDKDLASIVLQRKQTSGSNWKTIHQVDPKIYMEYPLENGELLPSNFIDTSHLEHRSYDYRLVAEDNSKNVSISDKQSVRPYDDGIRGQILNFSTTLLQNELKYLDLEGNTISLSDNGGNLPIGLEGGNTGGTSGTVVGGGNVQAQPKAVRLKWKYNTAYPKSLIGFKIYRKSPAVYHTDAIVTSPDYILLKTISKDRAARNATFFNMQDYMWFDRTVVPLRQGKYEYKIIAEHSDAGRSEWSEVLDVVYH